MQKFVLNNETVVNSYGFMLLNAGAKLERFNANPVMLFDHNSTDVIGRWKELEVGNGQITAAPEFDLDDENAKKISGKVERGFLKGASIGFLIHKAELKQVGDKKVPCVTEWTLLEASIVAMPSNEQALSLQVYDERGEMLSPENVKLNLGLLTKNVEKMEKIVLTAAAYTKLGVDSNADGTALSAAIEGLATRADSAELALSARIAADATAMVDVAIAEGRLTADRKESFVKLAIADHKQASDIIAALPPKQSLQQQISLGNVPEKFKGSWDELDKGNKLALLKAEAPELYKAKFEEKFGTKQ